MTARPTATERAAIKAGYAALLQSESPNSNIVETIVLGLGDRQMLMDPEIAEELRQLRERVANLDAVEALVTRSETDLTAGIYTTDLRAVLDGETVRFACGHGTDELCEDCGRCPCRICATCSVCACVCACAIKAEVAARPPQLQAALDVMAKRGPVVELTAPVTPPPVESLGQVIADRIRVIDDVEAVTIDDGSTLTVQVRPRDLDGWNWWLGRFQVPVASITNRGLVTTARGSAPGGVTVNIVGHGIAALQAAAVSYITQRGGESDA